MKYTLHVPGINLKGEQTMKTSTFYAAWNNHEPQPDPSMNRDRAAKLLKAWRRNSRKKTNNPLWICKRIAPHQYFVKVCEWGTESHTMIIGNI